ncbi:hypothetical protein J6590_037050 [Homalodisca vitripennis]|nr:hypothetical protein J6590_098048 [Homalodisca vitripennis]KAG8336834.1 hypothetical protein J6590_037050 [Homalodisca vitripennis]
MFKLIVYAPPIMHSPISASLLVTKLKNQIHAAIRVSLETSVAKTNYTSNKNSLSLQRALGHRQWEFAKVL